MADGRRGNETGSAGWRGTVPLPISRAAGAALRLAGGGVVGRREQLDDAAVADTELGDIAAIFAFTLGGTHHLAFDEELLALGAVLLHQIDQVGLEDGDGEPVGARLTLAFRGGDGEIEHREFVVFAIGILLGMDGSVGTQVTQQRETVHIEIPLECAAFMGQR